MLLTLSRLWASWSIAGDEGQAPTAIVDSKISIRLWGREDEIAPVQQGLDEPEPVTVLWLGYGNVRSGIRGSDETIPRAVEEEENATFLTMMGARIARAGTAFSGLYMPTEPVTTVTLPAAVTRRRLISVNLTTDIGPIT